MSPYDLILLNEARAAELSVGPLDLLTHTGTLTTFASGYDPNYLNFVQDSEYYKEVGIFKDPNPNL